MTLTQAEIDYLEAQALGRLATVDAKGAPQVNPVSFRYDAALGVIDVGGHNMGMSRKFRNVQAGSAAALVVDDIASFQPWTVRGVEIRGEAEALRDQPPQMHGFSGEVIRIRPRRVISWGVEPGREGMAGRDID